MKGSPNSTGSPAPLGLDELLSAVQGRMTGIRVGGTAPVTFDRPAHGYEWGTSRLNRFQKHPDRVSVRGSLS